MEVPFFFWLLLVIVAAVGLAVLSSRQAAAARRAFAGKVRSELLGYLSQRGRDDDSASAHPGAELAVLDLDRLCIALGGEGELDEALRRQAYAAVASFLDQGWAPPPGDLSLEIHSGQILPWVVSSKLLALLPAVPSKTLSGGELTAIYAVELPTAPALLSWDHLAELELEAEAAHRLALDNLRQRFDGAPVRRALAEGRRCRIEAEDAFAASRLLLIPELLEPGEILEVNLRDAHTLEVERWGGGAEIRKPSEEEPIVGILSGQWRVTAEGWSSGASPSRRVRSERMKPPARGR